MPDTSYLKDWYDQFDDDVKDWLSETLWYRELETIRRPQPLLDPTKFPVHTVSVWSQGGPAPQAAAGASSNKPPPAPQPASNVNLRGGNASRASVRAPRISQHLLMQLRSLPEAHGLLAQTIAKAGTVIALDDDDNNSTPISAQKPIPGPDTVVRNAVQQVRTQIGYSKAFDQEFRLEAAEAQLDYLNTGTKYSDQESMLHSPDWADYFQRYDKRAGPVHNMLFKGFPMAENVVFIKHPNYWTAKDKRIEDGQCYWLSLALLIYGNASAWLRVKAEHLHYLEKVLLNTEHPRHEFYKRENQTSTRTFATGPGPKWTGSVNLWEKLLIPGCWVNDDMCTLTADVYGVFLVLYKYDSHKLEWRNKVYDMKTFGSYNTRHIFVCYDGENHFQPMVPNDYYSYEFKLRRLTLKNTQNYKLVTKERSARRRADGPKHHWRSALAAIPPPLAQPLFHRNHLMRAVGYPPYGARSAPSQPSSTQPESSQSGSGLKPGSGPSGSGASGSGASGSGATGPGAASTWTGSGPPPGGQGTFYQGGSFKPVPSSQSGSSQQASFTQGRFPASGVPTPSASSQATNSSSPLAPPTPLPASQHGSWSSLLNPPQTPVPSAKALGKRPADSSSSSSSTQHPIFKRLRGDGGASSSATATGPALGTGIIPAASVVPATSTASGSGSNSGFSLGLGSSIAGPSNPKPAPTAPAPTPSTTVSKKAPKPKPAPAPQPKTHPPNTTFRKATRAVLTSKIKVDRLREWCLALGLVPSHGAAQNLKKDALVTRLSNANALVAMEHVGGGRGWVPVAKEQGEDLGHEVVKLPVPVVGGGATSASRAIVIDDDDDGDDDDGGNDGDGDGRDDA